MKLYIVNNYHMTLFVFTLKIVYLIIFLFVPLCFSPIQALLQLNPYHIDSLLQLSDVCRIQEDQEMARDLIGGSGSILHSKPKPSLRVTWDIIYKTVRSIYTQSAQKLLCKTSPKINSNFKLLALTS